MTFRLKIWMIAGAVVAAAVVVLVAKPDLISTGDGSTPAELARGEGDAGSSTEISGINDRAKPADVTGPGVSPDVESSMSVMAEGPDGYRSLLNRMIASGLMVEYGPEFTALLSGEQLRIAVPCDLETFLAQLKAASTPEEIRATLRPLAQALRDAIKNNDLEAADIQRQLGVALMFAAEQAADSSDLTAEQQLDRMVKIGAVLGIARSPELTLAMNDLAQGFLNVPDTQANRRNIDAVLRTRLEASATVQDLPLFDSAAQQWMELSKDQKDASVGSRYRLYAQRLASFPSARINSQSGATWPGLSELPANAIVNIGTNWLKVPGGADRSGYIAARDGLVQQVDEIIRARSSQASKADEVRKLQSFRAKLVNTRVR